jgi:hypothetical protein
MKGVAMNSFAKINEIARWVIKLPDQTYGSDIYAFVAQDDTGFTLLDEPNQSYSLIGDLCNRGKRAWLTVDQTLLGNGKPIAPEAYLRLWRKALEQATSPQAFVQQTGQTIAFDFSIDLERDSKNTSNWHGSHYHSIAQFIGEYGSSLTPADTALNVSIDFREPKAWAKVDSVRHLASWDQANQRYLSTATSRLHAAGAITTEPMPTRQFAAVQQTLKFAL